MIRGPLAPIEILSSLIETGAAAAPRAGLISRFGDIVGLCEARGWLTPGPMAGLVRCKLCDEGHDADVSFDEGAKRWRYCCVAVGGWADADDAELETRVVQVGLILRALRAALAPIRFALSEEVPGVLWRLGESERGGAAWTAMLARGVRNDDLVRILARLPAITAKRGIVLTTTPLARMLESGVVRFAPLEAVVDLDADGGFSICDGAIRAAWGSAREPRESRGRPPHHEDEVLAAVEALTLEELGLDDGDMIRLVVSRVAGRKGKNHGAPSKTLERRIVEQASARRAMLRIKP